MDRYKAVEEISDFQGLQGEKKGTCLLIDLSFFLGVMANVLELNSGGG